MSQPLAEAFIRVRPDSDGFARETRRQTDRAFSGLRGHFGGLGRLAGLALAGGVGIGVGALITSSVNLEKTFSQTMNVMAEVAQVPAREMQKLSGLAMKMGADTVFSANEAADAMLELAKGGLSAATIEAGALQGTLTLAAAGGIDLAEAATVASNALNTFGLQGKDMAAVAGALAGGANASSASIQSLAQALSQAGLGAVNAGLSLEETIAVLAAFDSAGIKGSDAGTALKTMLSRLVPSTDEAAKAMKRLKLNFIDAKGNFLPIALVAEQLRERLSGLSEAQRTLALSTIFGSDATRAASVLMKLGADGLGDYLQATEDVGAAQRVADARMKGTAGALEAMAGSIETAKLAFGQLLAPAVVAGAKGLATGFNAMVPAVQGLGPLVERLGDRAAPAVEALGDGVTTHLMPAFTAAYDAARDLAPEIGRIAEFITGEAVPAVAGFIGTGLVPFLGAVLDVATDIAPEILSVAIAVGTVLAGAVDVATGVLGPFAGFISDNTTLVGALAIAAGAAAVVIKGWAAATAIAAATTKLWAGAQGLLNIVMAANPILVAVAAVAALAGGLIYTYENSKTFRKTVDTAFRGVQSITGNVVGFMISAFRMLLLVWLEVTGGILHAAATAFGWLPGIGDDLKAADAEFRKFKDTTLATLDAMAQEAYGLGEKTGTNLKEGFMSIVGPDGLVTQVRATPSGRLFERPAERPSQQAAAVARPAPRREPAGEPDRNRPAGTGVRLHPDSIQALGKAVSSNVVLDTRTVSQRQGSRAAIAFGSR